MKNLNSFRFSNFTNSERDSDTNSEISFYNNFVYKHNKPSLRIPINPVRVAPILK